MLQACQELVDDIAQRQNIVLGTLSLHADRIAHVRSKPVTSLLVDLDITERRSQSCTSGGNFLSDTQFKTPECYPDLLGCFGCTRHLRVHGQTLFATCNDAHCHCVVGCVTCQRVPHGLAQDSATDCHAHLCADFAKYPSRSKGK